MKMLNNQCHQPGGRWISSVFLNVCLVIWVEGLQTRWLQSAHRTSSFLFHEQQPGGSGWEVWDNSCCSGRTIYKIRNTATSTSCVIQSYCKLQYWHSSSSCCWNHNGTGKDSSTYAAGRAAVWVLWCRVLNSLQFIFIIAVAWPNDSFNSSSEKVLLKIN